MGRKNPHCVLLESALNSKPGLPVSRVAFTDSRKRHAHLIHFHFVVYARVLLHAHSGQPSHIDFYCSTRRLDSDARRNLLDFLSSLYGGPAHSPPVPFISGVRAIHRPDGASLHDPVRPIHLVLWTAFRSAGPTSYYARLAGCFHPPYSNHSDGALRSANPLVEAFDGIGRAEWSRWRWR